MYCIIIIDVSSVFALHVHCVHIRLRHSYPDFHILNIQRSEGGPFTYWKLRLDVADGEIRVIVEMLQ